MGKVATDKTGMYPFFLLLEQIEIVGPHYIVQNKLSVPLSVTKDTASLTQLKDCPQITYQFNLPRAHVTPLQKGLGRQNRRDSMAQSRRFPPRFRADVPKAMRNTSHLSHGFLITTLLQWTHTWLENLLRKIANSTAVTVTSQVISNRQSAGRSGRTDKSRRLR